MSHGIESTVEKMDRYEQELEGHRAYLYRYALIQLRDPDRAEDAVQETLLAALASRGSFAGRSSLRTWLTSVLRNKIVDIIRKHAREWTVGDALDTNASGDSEFDRLFRSNGSWNEMPSRWGDPDGSLESKDFWRIFEICNQAMPVPTARVFMMREVLDLGTEEICKELGITPSNCHVMLYRARMRLRRCFDENWFGKH